MADLTVTALDSLSGSRVRYEIGKGNWAPSTEAGRGWVPDLGGAAGDTVQLEESQRIDVLILGDGFETESSFRSKLDAWIKAFFDVKVYEQFRGAFRIRALYTRSAIPAAITPGSFYGVGIDDDGDILRNPHWWQENDERGTRFRERLRSSIGVFTDANLIAYPSSLSHSPVLHNRLAGLCSNLVVIMLVRAVMPSSSSPPSTSPVGMTRRVDFESFGLNGVNVGFGENSLHEFGHAFAYLEDEYIQERGSRAARHNPSTPSVFNLSNLSFDTRVDHVPWLHLSPWGLLRRQAAGTSPSPIVGWLWRGGEHDERVWHSEYQCLMNGMHENYAYTPDAPSDPTANPPTTTSCNRFLSPAGCVLRWRKPPTYCLWCEEIVVIRTLEKTGQLETAHDDDSIDERGRDWYQDWVTEGRAAYWETFEVADRIREREEWYANPSLRADDLCQLLRDDGTYLRLDASPLYQVFDAEPHPTASAPEPEDGDLLLMANG
jgi:hypothetical protein